MYLSLTQTPTGAQGSLAARRPLQPTQNDVPPAKGQAPTFPPHTPFNDPMGQGYGTPPPGSHPRPGERPFLIPPPTQLGNPKGIPKARSAAWVAGITGAVAIVFIVGFYVWRKKGKPPLFTERRLSDDNIPFLPLRDDDDIASSRNKNTRPFLSRPISLHSTNSYRLAQTNRSQTLPLYYEAGPA